jgi:uncharacterized protein (TIGR03000 family)
MKRWSIASGAAALALVASTLSASSAAAQPPGNRYPYYDTAPGTYPRPGANLPTLPPPGAPRDAFRPSPWVFGGAGVGAFGGAPYSYLYDARQPAGRPAPPDNRARIWLAVPADAEVWFDGEPTKQTGGLRQFVSPPLAPGRSYTYAVRVRWTKDGQPVEEERRISVRAGAWSRFDFTPSAGENDAATSRAFGMMRFAVPK